MSPSVYFHFLTSESYGNQKILFFSVSTQICDFGDMSRIRFTVWTVHSITVTGLEQTFAPMLHEFQFRWSCKSKLELHVNVFEWFIITSIVIVIIVVFKQIKICSFIFLVSDRIVKDCTIVSKNDAQVLNIRKFKEVKMLFFIAKGLPFTKLFSWSELHRNRPGYSGTPVYDKRNEPSFKWSTPVASNWSFSC